MAVAAATGVTLALSQAAGAADIDTNLVVNGDFESVDPSVTLQYSNAQITGGWSSSDGTEVFAYNYSQSYDDRNDMGEVPPGNDPFSSTDYYFSLNGTDVPAVQVIDLSEGASAALISSGGAQYDLKAYFTNYASDMEGGMLVLEFYDGDPGLTGLDANLIGEPISFIDTNLDEWTLVGEVGAIPTTAKWARIIIDLNPELGQSSGPDVYVDNVSFMVIGGGPGKLEITDLNLTETGTVALTWNSIPEAIYSLEYSTDLTVWTEITDAIPSGGTETVFEVDDENVKGERLFFRVYEP